MVKRMKKVIDIFSVAFIIFLLLYGFFKIFTVSALKFNEVYSLNVRNIDKIIVYSGVNNIEHRAISSSVKEEELEDILNKIGNLRVYRVSYRLNRDEQYVMNLYSKGKIRYSIALNDDCIYIDNFKCKLKEGYSDYLAVYLEDIKYILNL